MKGIRILGLLTLSLLLSVSAALAQEKPSFWLPRPASATAAEVDSVFALIYWISVVFFALIVGLLVWFVIRYRKRAGHEEAVGRATHNTALEIVWSVIPTLLVILIFWRGFKAFMDMATPPQNAYEVLVTGQKWKWSFTYPNGYVDEMLHVPVDVPVRLVLASEDVIHSFFVPDFRIKKDAVPGRYTKAWFQAKAPGEHDIFCAEYCGTSHSDMRSSVIVHPPGEFEKWLDGAANFLDKLPPAEAGQKLYTSRGCAQCHSADGRAGIGPTFKRLWNHPVPLKGGGTVVADENYVRESILEPQAKIVAGFDPVMPTYKGRLKDQEITKIVEYLKSLEK